MNHPTLIGLTVLVAIGWPGRIAAAQTDSGNDSAAALRGELKDYDHRIVFETRRNGNWDLFLVNADGSNPVNLTRTPDVDELYPKASPDGTQICFVADEGEGKNRIRNLYLMNADGTRRRKLAKKVRDPCWSPDGRKIAYLKGELERHSVVIFATKGLMIYDLKEDRRRPHPNEKIHHLFTLDWSPDAKWFISTVHGGMGFKHSIIAIEADGQRVVDLRLPGCRADVSFDGKRVAWGHGDYSLGVADLSLGRPDPKTRDFRKVVRSAKPVMTYHVDWSPDGRYVAFTRGPKFLGKRLSGATRETPGVEAPGWNICVADAARENRWVEITSDGLSNKEPDWVVVRKKKTE